VLVQKAMIQVGVPVFVVKDKIQSWKGLDCIPAFFIEVFFFLMRF